MFTYPTACYYILHSINCTRSEWEGLMNFGWFCPYTWVHFDTTIFNSTDYMMALILTGRKADWNNKPYIKNYYSRTKRRDIKWWFPTTTDFQLCQVNSHTLLQIYVVLCLFFCTEQGK